MTLPTQGTQLRLALTISGAVALGAYEGGALAGLLVAVQALADKNDPPLVIDVMAGASAGSITALLAARCLLEGYDPLEVMRGAWVEQDSLSNLRGHTGAAPLSIDALRTMASTLLEPRGAASEPRQSGAVRLSMAIACLRGLEYTMPTLGSRIDAQATTYLDWCDYTLTPGMPIADLSTGRPDGFPAPVDTALASAANAMGFPPYLLDRSDDRDWQRLLDAGITNLPASRQLWYTDGGTLDNEPLGRALNLVGDPGDPDQVTRLHVLIHPHPTGAPLDDAWADPTSPPSWTQTAMRSLGLQRTQSLFADLKNVEKTNSRIAWAETLCEHLSTALDTLEPTARAAVQGALLAAQREIGHDRATRLGSHPSPDADNNTDPATGVPTSTVLGPLLRRVAGVSGKQQTAVEVISPLLLPEATTHGVEQLLAGEVLFHFGGFLDRDARVSDFDLGYRSALRWLERGGLAHHGLDSVDNSTALQAVRARYQPPTPAQSWQTCGSRTVADLLGRHPLAGVEIAAQITRVLANDVLHHHKNAPHPPQP